MNNQKITRRDFIGKSLAAGLTIGALPQRAMGQRNETEQSLSPKLGNYVPRGTRRIMYVSDYDSISSDYLPDPVSEQDLQLWVDELAAVRVNTFIQDAYAAGFTTYWRADGFDYMPHPRMRRFLPLMDAGVQPLDVLLRQSHRRGMEFLAAIRINDSDGHRDAVKGGSFIMKNPQWGFKEAPPGPLYAVAAKLTMDFSFPEVRDYLFSIAEALVSRFDVDGLELSFRDNFYFPPKRGRQSQPLMTELVRRIRLMLDQKGRERNKKLQLGARVYETVEGCQDLGLDVLNWISDGLLNYIAPGDMMYSDLNAPYEKITQVARASDCLVYPALYPWSSARMRRRKGGMPISLEEKRAIAKNFYGAGADGISLFNHHEHQQSAPFYPMMLQDCIELRDAHLPSHGDRHYVFEPIWAGCRGFGEGRAVTGTLKADKIVLKRADPDANGTYRFRICEDFKQVRRASLLFRGHPMTEKDKIEVRLNGVSIPLAKLRRRNNEHRVDLAAPVDVASRTASGEVLVPDIGVGPFLTTWFDLTGPPAVYGDNWLEIKLIETDPEISQDLLIEEIEVFIRPKLT